MILNLRRNDTETLPFKPGWAVIFTNEHDYVLATFASIYNAQIFIKANSPADREHLSIREIVSTTP